MSHINKQEVVEQIRAEANAQIAQELFQHIAEKCFTKCVVKPGTKLDRNEESCLTRCMERYAEAINIVSQAMSESGSH